MAARAPPRASRTSPSTKAFRLVLWSIVAVNLDSVGFAFRGA